MHRVVLLVWDNLATELNKSVAGVAFLESQFGLDLQHAMLLVPTFYCLSGIAFYGAEAIIKKEQS